MIKRIAFAAAAILTASFAHAADLSFPAPYAAPAVAPIADVTNNWTGFYVGGNAGILTGTKSGSGFTGSSDGDFAAGFVGNRLHSSSNTGGLFGATIGYNYQIAPSFVLGVEGDYGWANTDRRSNYAYSMSLFPGVADVIYDVNASTRSQLDSFGTLRARAGYLVTPNLMLFGTGGLAFGSIKTSAHAVDTITSPLGVATFSDVAVKNTKTKVGWTVGVGAEYAFNRNWSVKAEYLYASLGKTNVSFPGEGLYNFAAKSKNDFHIGRVGVNYRF